MRRRWRWALWALASLAVLPLAFVFLATLSLSPPSFLITSVIPAHAHFVGGYPPSMAAEVQETVRAVAAAHDLLFRSDTRPPAFEELGTLFMSVLTPSRSTPVMSAMGTDTGLYLMFKNMDEQHITADEIDAFAADVVAGLNGTLHLKFCREDLARGLCARPAWPRVAYAMGFGGVLVEEPGQEIYDAARRWDARVAGVWDRRMRKVTGGKAGRFECRFYRDKRSYRAGVFPLLLTNAPQGDRLLLKVFDRGGMPSEDLDGLVRDVRSSLERRYGRRFCRARPDTGACDAEHRELEGQRSAWLEARAVGTAAAVEAFLAAHPGSRHAEAARRRLARLRAMEAPPPPAPPPPAKPWAGRSAGERFADTLGDGSQGPAMTVVPAGLFHSGCVSGVGCRLDELPVRPVRVARPFALSIREVTHAEYFRHARPGKRIEPWWADRPVTHLTWAEAAAYAGWLSERTGAAYRLPSEAEWEWAARAGTRTAYSWGDEVGEQRALCAYCWGFSTASWVAPAGSYAANPWGFLDMHGNAAEWTSDCWNPDHLGASSDSSARLDGDCSRRVVRGGSYDTPPRAIRSAARVGKPADERYLDVGFRVLRELRPSGPRTTRRKPSATP